MKLNKRGITELGIVYFLVAAMGTVAGSGAVRLFSGGPDAVSSGVIVAAQLLTLHSQLPSVKRDFREKKAVEEFGYSGVHVKTMSDESLLAAIRDDKPALAGDNNGNFVRGYQYGVRAN